MVNNTRRYTTVYYYANMILPHIIKQLNNRTPESRVSIEYKRVADKERLPAGYTVGQLSVATDCHIIFYVQMLNNRRRSSLVLISNNFLSGFLGLNKELTAASTVSRNAIIFSIRRHIINHFRLIRHRVLLRKRNKNVGRWRVNEIQTLYIS